MSQEPWVDEERAALEELVLANLHVIEVIASKVIRTMPSRIERDDLVQAGRVGLLEAARRYDPDNAQGATFYTFCSHRILGAILDECRREDRTSRADREKGVTRTYETINYSSTRWAVNPEHEDVIWKRWVVRALRDLPPREQEVLLRIYYDDFRLEDICPILGVNASRVSQLKIRALGRLRSRLEMEGLR